MKLFLASVGLAFACSAQAPTNHLRDFFTALTDNRPAARMPSYDEVVAVVDDVIPSAPPETLKNALPAILKALDDRNDDVKKYALLALHTIATRSDDAELLHPYLGTIAVALYSSGDSGVQRGALLTILDLRPAPPPGAVPILLRFLESRRAADDVVPNIVFGLVRVAPNSPEVVKAVSNVLSKKFKTDIRINILNALGDPSVRSPVLIDDIAAEIRAADRTVQIAAIDVIRRIGTQAVSRASPTLSQVAQNSTDREVASAARHALEGK